jgi:hypothetical protein
MTVIDRDGRVFGRFNIIDAAVLAFIVLLVPIGYATFLLFRPSRPAIDSVTQTDVTNEERRVSGAGVVIAKLKIKGSGFNPMLRAGIGSKEAIGFVFENPNSADVIVGVLPPGKHDLVLYDGVQEVARARDAVEIRATSGPSIRLYGWMTGLDKAAAEAFKPGYASDANEPSAFRVLALGPVRAASTRVTIGSRIADLPIAGKVERAAELLVRCDWPGSGACSIGGQSLQQPPPIGVNLPGFRFEIDEVAPPEEPSAATVTIQLSSPAAGMKSGDRDAVASTGAAEITAISGNTLTLKLGVHESREGWRYRGQLVEPGSTLQLRTESHAVTGTVTSVRVAGQ